MSLTRPGREPDHVIVTALTIIEGSDKAKSGHNKFWIAQVWDQEGIGQRNWGRMSKPIESVLADIKAGKSVGQQKLERKPLSFYEKEASYRTDPNGTSSKYAVVKYGRAYKRINLVSAADLQLVTGPADDDDSGDNELALTLHPQVHTFISLITSTASQHIQSHFSGDVAAMSPQHIRDARGIIQQAVGVMPNFGATTLTRDDAIQAYLKMPSKDQKAFRGIMNDYWSTIPTVLPRKSAEIVDQLAGEFMLNLLQGEIEDRLEQLETAAKVALAQKRQGKSAVPSDPVAVAYSQMGCLIQPVMPNSDEYTEIVRRFNLKSKHGHKAPARIKGIFAVHIPSERDAFLQDPFGKLNQKGELAVLPLFHGTKFPNTQHILRTGLIIKSVAANGSRFGRGLYHSSSASRSWMYTNQSRQQSNIMFISHVAIGTPYVDNDSNSRIDLEWVKKKGCHSVLGEGEWGRQGDEFITYSTAQSTISYALLLEAS